MEKINSSVTFVLDTHLYDVVLQEMAIVLHNIGPNYRLLLMDVKISNIISDYDCSSSSSSSSGGSCISSISSSSNSCSSVSSSSSSSMKCSSSK